MYVYVALMMKPRSVLRSINRDEIYSVYLDRAAAGLPYGELRHNNGGT